MTTRQAEFSAPCSLRCRMAELHHQLEAPFESADSHIRLFYHKPSTEQTTTHVTWLETCLLFTQRACYYKALTHLFRKETIRIAKNCKYPCIPATLATRGQKVNFQKLHGTLSALICRSQCPSSGSRTGLQLTSHSASIVKTFQQKKRLPGRLATWPALPSALLPIHPL